MNECLPANASYSARLKKIGIFTLLLIKLEYDKVGGWVNIK